MTSKDVLGDMEFEHLPDWIDNSSRDRAAHQLPRRPPRRLLITNEVGNYPYALRNIGTDL
jgi:hypothetical protein